MQGINKAIILGTVGKDPELKTLPSGVACTTFSIATHESYKDKKTNETVQLTEWHRIVLYSKLAEIAGRYVKKGKLVYIEGQIRTKKWQDKDDKDCYMTEIIGKTLELVGSRSQDPLDEVEKEYIKPSIISASVATEEDDIPF